MHETDSMFTKITDPETNNEVSLNSAIGQQIIRNYIEAIKHGADSKNIISTRKFYAKEPRKSSSKKNIMNESESSYERGAKKLTSKQFDSEELLKNKYCGNPTDSWNVRSNKIVWTQRSSGKWQLGIIGDCNNNKLDIYFNNGEGKIGCKKGLSQKDLLPTTARLSNLLK